MTSNSSSGAKFPTKLRRNTGRTRTGCLTCRRRKKKCDETRPQCLGCTRNKLECTWPQETKDQSSVSSGQSPSTVHDDDQSAAASPSLSPFRSSTPSTALITTTVSTLWCEALGSFVSPTRVIFLTSRSREMLRHYIVGSGPLLLSVASWHNPFLSVVLPLAYVDDLLMHCVIAVGGAHLSCKCQDQPDLHEATHHHYLKVLQGLREGLRDLKPQDVHKILRILLVLTMLSLYETISISCTDGGIFSHIKASRQLITWLSEGPCAPTADQDREAFAFVLEYHAYLILINEICPSGVLPDRTAVPHEDMATMFNQLRRFDSFGVVFIGYHDLFQLIPDVAELAADRVRAGETARTSREEETRYVQLAARIRGWQNPGYDAHSATEQEHKAMGEVYRHALWIFLETAMNGSAPPGPVLRERLGRHLELLATSILGNQLPVSRVAPVLLWPIMIAGSVVSDASGRALLSESMRTVPYVTWSVVRGAELLELLWADEDPRAYGPYGLYMVMKKHNISLCIS
ncbi:hypothetical protein VTK73DRAFT_3787 [Phialemonium thermophilum]|uniref:Zn(2)-C6 fungal-type domain-containing protein n=1 Tax=Phialemonium thermophilum TaxID=223376 RepID=A0ABR3WX18_9PEZI